MEDVNLFLQYFNLFPLKGGNRQKHTAFGPEPSRGVMIFDSFKKTFFPHLHQSFNLSEVLKSEGVQGSNTGNQDTLKLPE